MAERTGAVGWLVTLPRPPAAKSSFLANMSHELRTLNAIMGMTELALRRATIRASEQPRKADQGFATCSAPTMCRDLTKIEAEHVHASCPPGLPAGLGASRRPCTVRPSRRRTGAGAADRGADGGRSIAGRRLVAAEPQLLNLVGNASSPMPARWWCASTSRSRVRWWSASKLTTPHRHRRQGHPAPVHRVRADRRYSTGGMAAPGQAGHRKGLQSMAGRSAWTAAPGRAVARFTVT